MRRTLLEEVREEGVLGAQQLDTAVEVGAGVEGA